MHNKTDILIITEDHDIAVLLPAVLALVPELVTEVARSVESALEILRSNRASVIIVDLDWPHTFDQTEAKNQAIDLLKRLQNSQDAQDIPIIGLSSALSYYCMSDLGLNDGILKPFDIDYFLQRVQLQLAKHQTQQPTTGEQSS